jgi:protein TonB
MDNKRYLDIIFHGFSKSYSAYWNRTHKGPRVLLSFTTAILIIGLILYPLFPKPAPSKASSDTLKVKQRKVIQYSQLSAPPPIELVKIKPPKRKKVAEGKKVASKKFVKPTVKPDAEVEKEDVIPSQEELKYVNPGIKDEEGDSLQNVALLGDGDGEGMEIEYDVIELEEEPVEEEIFDFVEQKATFPGGVKALYQYLGEHIRYPTLARENNISGRVIVQFVIEKDGSITHAEIARDIGGRCGEEAVRVVMSMPKWTPAEQNGIKVRSRFTLPVTFTIAR